MARETAPLSMLRDFSAQAGRQPMLSPEEEQRLSRQWADDGNRAAFDRLVRSHMRLAVKIAGRFARSGLPVGDLVSEANIGLVKAVQRFDPDRGFRLATYALWWIRAEVQGYVLRNWSLLRGGNTAALKRLFFNLRRTQQRLGLADRTMSDAEVERVAVELSASPAEVREMELRFATPVTSLNQPVGEDGDAELQDMLPDDTESVEVKLAAHSELVARRALMAGALERLAQRERHIFVSRNLSEDPITLETLAGQYGVSKERIRQIESAAYQKVATWVRAADAEPTASLPTASLPMASKRARLEVPASKARPIRRQYAPPPALGTGSRRPELSAQA